MVPICITFIAQGQAGESDSDIAPHKTIELPHINEVNVTHKLFSYYNVLSIFASKVSYKVSRMHTHSYILFHQHYSCQLSVVRLRYTRAKFEPRK